jgi:hypothetical protein
MITKPRQPTSDRITRTLIDNYNLGWPNTTSRYTGKALLQSGPAERWDYDSYIIEHGSGLYFLRTKVVSKFLQLVVFPVRAIGSTC